MRTYAQIESDLAEAQAKIDRLAAEANGADGDALARLQVGLQRATEDHDALLAEKKERNRAWLGDLANTEGPFVGGHPSWTGPSKAGARADGPISQLRSQAERTIDGLHRAGTLPDHAAEAATALLSAGTSRDQGLAARWASAAGSPEYLGAFLKLMGDPDKGHLLWTPQEADAYRAVAGVQDELRAAGMTLDGGTGGYMVPLTLDPAILLSSAGTTNAMRKVARIVRTMTNTWQGVTSAGVTAEWPGEATQVAEATPTLAPVSIPVFLGDAYTHYSFAVGMDAVDFSSQLQALLLDAADNLQAAAYTAGGGVTAPKGIITALTAGGAASKINTKGSEALAATDPFDLQAALPARFSPRAQFMAALPIINAYAIMESANGARIFPEIRDGRLLNRPLVENSDMDSAINAAATEHNYVAVYGDFSHFIIADRVGSTLELIPNVMGANGRPTGERGALLWFRTGSDVDTVNAFRLLDVPTTA